MGYVSPLHTPDMKASLTITLLLCLFTVEAMRGGRRRGRQDGGGGGGSDCGDPMECLRQSIPGEPGQDYPIHPPSILCKLNPRNQAVLAGAGSRGGGVSAY